MNKSDIEYILDCFGFTKIMSDHGLSKINVLEILDDHNYIDLEIYLEKDAKDDE